MARLIGFLLVLLWTVVAFAAVLAMVPLDWPLWARLGIGIGSALVAPTIVAFWFFSLLHRREVAAEKTRLALVVVLALLQGGLIALSIFAFDRRPNDLLTATVALFMEPREGAFADAERGGAKQDTVPGDTESPVRLAPGVEPSAEQPGLLGTGGAGATGANPPTPIPPGALDPLPEAGAQPVSTKLGLESFHLWSTRLGSRGHDSVTGLAVTPKGATVIVVRGALEPKPGVAPAAEGSSIVLYFLGADGEARWHKAIAATTISATDLATDTAGNIYVLGMVSGTVDFGRGAIELPATHGFLVKYAPSGAYGWLQLIQVPKGSVQKIGLAPSGEILVTGTFPETLEVGGRRLTSEGPGNLFIAKLSPSGQPIWLKQLGETRQRVWAEAIGFHRDETVLVGQYVGGGEMGKSALQPLGPDLPERGVFALRLTQGGKPIVSNRLQYSFDQGMGFSAVIDRAGNVIMARGFWGEVKGEDYAHTSEDALDLFVGKFDRDGRRLWSHSFGGIHDQAFPKLAIDKQGRVFVTGNASLGIDLGHGRLTAAGTSDIFVGIYSPQGKAVGSALLASNYRGGAGGVAINKAGKVILAGTFADEINLGGKILKADQIETDPQPDVFVAKLSW